MAFACLAWVGSVDAATPYAATPAPAGITATRATLTGMATANDSAAVAWFEGGSTTAYGPPTSPVDVGAGRGVVRVSGEINDLVPHQIYHYRLVVNNAAGVVHGAEQRFVTGGKVAAWSADENLPADLTNVVAIGVGFENRLAI